MKIIVDFCGPFLYKGSNDNENQPEDKMWNISAAKIRGTEMIGFIDFSRWCETEEEAVEAMNLFPKYVRPRKIRGSVDGRTVPVISFRIDFTEYKGNPKNETGVKRLRKALEVIRDDYEMNTFYSNAATMEEVVAIIS